MNLPGTHLKMFARKLSPMKPDTRRILLATLAGLATQASGLLHADLGKTRSEVEQDYTRSNRITQEVGGEAERLGYTIGTLEAFVTYWNGEAAMLEYRKLDGEPFDPAEVEFIVERIISPERLEVTHAATYREYRLSEDGETLVRISHDPEKKPSKIEFMTRAFFETIEYPKYENPFPGINAGMADLEVRREGLPEESMVGEQLKYRVLVTNLGPETARGVRLKEFLSNQQILEIQCDRDEAEAQFREFDNEASVTLGDLAEGETVTIEFQIRLAAAGNLVSTTNLEAETIDPDSTNSDLITREGTRVAGRPAE